MIQNLTEALLFQLLLSLVAKASKAWVRFTLRRRLAHLPLEVIDHQIELIEGHIDSSDKVLALWHAASTALWGARRIARRETIRQADACEEVRPTTEAAHRAAEQTVEQTRPAEEAYYRAAKQAAEYTSPTIKALNRIIEQTRPAEEAYYRAAKQAAEYTSPTIKALNRIIEKMHTDLERKKK